MPKKIKKMISIIGVGGGRQPDDEKFHHVFTFFFLTFPLILLKIDIVQQTAKK